MGITLILILLPGFTHVLVGLAIKDGGILFCFKQKTLEPHFLYFWCVCILCVGVCVCVYSDV